MYQAVLECPPRPTSMLISRLQELVIALPMAQRLTVFSAGQNGETCVYLKACEEVRAAQGLKKMVCGIAMAWTRKLILHQTEAIMAVILMWGHVSKHTDILPQQF